MDLAESQAEASRILAEAGWRADPGWGGFHHGTCVGGLAPNGTLYVKNWAQITPEHPKYSADTPDEPHEAAAWLVAHAQAKVYRFRRKAPPSSHDEEVMPASVDAASYQSMEGWAGARHAGRAGLAEHLAEDADFIESAPEFVDDAVALPELEAPELGAEIADAEEESQAQFIFGDNLALDRLVRIGQLADEADVRIAEARAAVNWSDSEFAAVQSHVTTNMDKATGMYAGGVQALYDRFVQLSEVQALEHRISQHRDAQQTYIRSAGHEAVATFEPGAGWP